MFPLRIAATRLLALTCVIGLGSLMTACGTNDDKATDPAAGASEPAAQVTTADLAGQTFSGNAVEGREILGGTLRLSFANDAMSAYAGCNTMTGPYAVDAGRLSWTSDAASTMIGCPEDLAAQDAWLNNLFQDGITATMDDGNLVLTADDVTFRLRAAGENGLPDLLGRTWRLTSIIDADSVSSLPMDLPRDPRVKVAIDGSASVDTGCNKGRTTVAVTGARITFSPMGLTRMACPGSAGETEQALLAVLDGTTAATWDGTTLRLMKGERGLEFTVR